MLDLRFIRDHVEEVRAGAEAKGITVDLQKIIEFDDRRRTLILEGDTLKAKRNQISAQVGKIKREGGDASAVIAEMDSVKKRLQEIDPETREVETASERSSFNRTEYSAFVGSCRQNSCRQ